jgi:hypothetical protein
MYIMVTAEAGPGNGGVAMATITTPRKRTYFAMAFRAGLNKARAAPVNCACKGVPAVVRCNTLDLVQDLGCCSPLKSLTSQTGTLCSVLL